jgi:hypothetical protein
MSGLASAVFRESRVFWANFGASRAAQLARALENRRNEVTDERC